MTNITKSPRLYVPMDLSLGWNVYLDGAPHHYLKNVMRIEIGQTVRLFNGRDGEFWGDIISANKKTIDINLSSLLRPQILRTQKTALIFAPLKKERNDILIEKSVELDVTDFYPIITQNTDVRKINEDRLTAQMVEAAEQCERMDIPTLHPIQTLPQLLSSWDKRNTIFAAIERIDGQNLRGQTMTDARTLLIGPAGGFSDDEKSLVMAKDFIIPVSLGYNILRAETAAIVGLALFNSQ